MKLWQKENQQKGDVTNLIDSFTAGKDKEFDLSLAAADIEGSLAHTAMLVEINLLSKEEFGKIEQELKSILALVKAGNFSIEAGVEDVHSQIELMLTRAIGDAGKKIHSGRSRNDQVLVDVKLFLRSQLKDISKEIQTLFTTLQTLSETHKDKLLPGYTHLQVAMPSSFGLWFGAYAESLVDDMELVIAAYRVANKNPLGSGAGFGSSFPLKRELTTKLLKFDTLNYNAVYAQMSRGKTEKICAMALASVSATLARMAMDICLYMGQNFRFLTFPDELCTGSSIMPHKKNPDVFELIRARCNRLQALPNELTMFQINLPSGYHRDLQLTKECLFPALEELRSCLKMTDYMLQHIQVRSDIMKEEKYTYIWSVEAVNEQVLKGVPFRDAYKNVGKEISSGTFLPNQTLQHTHEGSIGNLCTAEIKKEMEKRMSAIL
ncbi:MAG TPA: argininosuccinate lyase [Bacteroidia bacterium]|jgi:argininosuccinate lyase|nr:argininosuccinate lyase [Bacteroidia bacterium]